MTPSLKPHRRQLVRQGSNIIVDDPHGFVVEDGAFAVQPWQRDAIREASRAAGEITVAYEDPRVMLIDPEKTRAIELAMGNRRQRRIRERNMKKAKR